MQQIHTVSYHHRGKHFTKLRDPGGLGSTITFKGNVHKADVKRRLQSMAKQNNDGSDFTTQVDRYASS